MDSLNNEVNNDQKLNRELKNKLIVKIIKMADRGHLYLYIDTMIEPKIASILESIANKIEGCIIELILGEDSLLQIPKLGLDSVEIRIEEGEGLIEI